MPFNDDKITSPTLSTSSPAFTDATRPNGAYNFGPTVSHSWQQQVAELKYRLRIERAVYEGAGKVLNAFMGPQKGAEKTTKLKVILHQAPSLTNQVFVCRYHKSLAFRI